MTKSKLTSIGYWASTGLVGVGLLLGGLSQFLRAPDVSATMAHLGYPAYFSTIIGTWKVLGALAVLAPGLPRVKEWAYAGIAFNLSGAAISHLAAGDALATALPPLFLLSVAAVSYSLRPASRKLTLAAPAVVTPALAEARAAA